MSLAEELMADLDNFKEEFEEDIARYSEIKDVDDFNTANGNAITSDMIKHDSFSKNLKSVYLIAKLRHSGQLAAIMSKIEKFQLNNNKRDKIFGPVEADPEYLLIVEANNLAVEIDNEINVIHKYIRDIYSKCFPELESLIPSSVEYVRTVKHLGNDILAKSKDSSTLQQFLSSASIMVVSVTASTTQGVQLDSGELERLMEACEMAEDLVFIKASILRYIESRMHFIAPNLSILVGSSVAAKLMGQAGGLTTLSKIPSCNVKVLGGSKRALGGLSKASILPHTGYIYSCELVQKLPPDLRLKANKLIAAKATIAARVDAQHESQDGRIGYQLLSEIERKFDKWQEPPPVKQIKPLPVPIEAPSKKRGGRRYRKMKERLGLTDFRQRANRMVFGSVEDDAYQADLNISVTGGGCLAGNTGTGSSKVRGPVVDPKTKARISKSLANKLHKQDQLHQQAYGGSTTIRRNVAGTASSVAFTPLQGFEIVNPQAVEKKTDEPGQYFSNQASFKKPSQI